MQKLILLAAFICVSLLSCSKGDTPDGPGNCTDNYLKVITDNFTTTSQEQLKGGSYVPIFSPSPPVVTRELLDCNLAKITTSLGSFEANCAKTVVAPLKIDGAASDGNSTLTYTESNQTLVIIQKDSNGDTFKFTLVK